ncbi:sodium:proton antiporter [Devosia nitrariae]|uniref:Sodium:proton antiporter n=1 Tax=Devosia nitrariae TaxID=2071872 RepID=A0ABQ5W339_9HYPH|nr:sodium:proton antiporter [Devosia nitrariae]
MYHDTPLITTIVAGLVLAFIFGALANRLRLPPLVGYLFAGILVGPHSPGFVADQELAAELAELGVILLMFGVGLHFSLRDLMSVRALAVPGAIVQIGFATLLGLGLGFAMGWDLGAGLIFGLALSVASTVVLLKALQDRRLIETERGRIAVGWLIVEDIAMILALVLIPAIASIAGNGESLVHDPFVSFVERVLRTNVGIWGVLALTIVKLAAFVGFMLVVGRRVIPWALHATAHTGSRELFRLAVLAIALGVALGSSVLFGVSLALGAFFAGMILSESELSHRAAQETLPLRDAFAVLFFVSVGMLFDPSIVLTDPLPLIATVFIIIVGKSLAAFGIVVLFRRPVSTALTISASLAQIGEFSFILASMGVALAIMPAEGQDLILAGALISIILNPLVFATLDFVRPRLESRIAQRRAAHHEPVEPFDGPLMPSETMTANDAMSSAAPEPQVAAGEPDEQAVEDDLVHPTSKTDHIILVGFGRVGGVVGEGLHAAGLPLVVIEDSDTSIKAAREMGIEVVVGNAASVDVLRLANLEAARTLLIAIPNSFEAGQVVEQGRKINPGIRIIARAHSDEEESYLANLGADTVIMGEREIGLGMLAWVKGEREAMAAAVAEAIRLAPTENVIESASRPAATEAAVPAEPTEAQGTEDVPPPATTVADEPEPPRALPDEPIPLPHPAVEEEALVPSEDAEVKAEPAMGLGEEDPGAQAGEEEPAVAEGSDEAEEEPAVAGGTDAAEKEPATGGTETAENQTAVAERIEEAHEETATVEETVAEQEPAVTEETEKAEEEPQIPVVEPEPRK